MVRCSNSVASISPIFTACRRVQGNPDVSTASLSLLSSSNRRTRGFTFEVTASSRLCDRKHLDELRGVHPSPGSNTEPTHKLPNPDDCQNKIN